MFTQTIILFFKRKHKRKKTGERPNGAVKNECGGAGTSLQGVNYRTRVDTRAGTAIKLPMAPPRLERKKMSSTWEIRFL